MEFKNLENKRFGMLTVIGLAPKTKNRSTLWLCKCDCGNQTTVRNKNLTEGIVKDCGCISKNELAPNQKIARLTLISSTSYGRGKKWECVCECGTTLVLKEYHIRKGMVKSCGCLKEEYAKKGNVTHGFNRTRLQRIYYSMKKRCYLKSHTHYKNYGGRGIKVCDEWLGREGITNFITWAIQNGYRDGLSIDRIDNNGDYTPNNCKWSTPTEQQNNTRANHLIEYKGEVLSVSAMARKYNIKPSTLFGRLRKWGDVAKAIETPISNK